MKLAIVTATTNPGRARACIESWRDTASDRQLLIHTIVNGSPYLGTVPAFRLGMAQVLEETDADLIACLHDDFAIAESSWDDKVRKHFERHPACGLAGFGGAIGLGADDLYQVPYAPMQLARQGFRSNLSDAEAHGYRSLLPEPVACLDGFSQIGTRLFWEGYRRRGTLGGAMRMDVRDAPWTVLEDLGIVHHFYDGLLGCLARRYNWETWYLPVRGTHYGGQTAVGEAGYADWARTQTTDGDQGFWAQAHALGYKHFRDVLPLRV